MYQVIAQKKAIIFSLLLTSVAMFSVRGALDAQTFGPMVTNSSFEQSWMGFESDAYTWNNFHNGFKRTQTAPRTGSWSIEVSNTDTNSLAGAYQRIDLNQTELKPVFIGGYVRGNNIQAAPGSYFGASLYAEIHLADGQILYWNTPMNVGTFDWRWIGFNTGSILNSRSIQTIKQPISYILVVPILGNASGTAWFDDITIQEFQPTRSAVTVMFDDGNDTDYSIARSILKSHGFPGTAAVITGDIDQADSLTWGQIKLLYRDGWEIMTHSVSHRDLTTVSLEEAEQELGDSKNTLTGKKYPVVDTAFPFGAYNGNILGVTQKYYASGRTYEIGDNPMGVFPYGVKVWSFTDSTTIRSVNTWLRLAKENNRWAIFVFHRLSDTGDDAYHTSPAFFEQVMQAVADSGIPVITYNQGVALFGASRQ